MPRRKARRDTSPTFTAAIRSRNSRSVIGSPWVTRPACLPPSLRSAGQNSIVRAQFPADLWCRSGSASPAWALSGGFPACKGAHRDRLVGRARAIGADFRDRDSSGFGNDRADDRPADAALTWSHAAAGESLQLVRSRRAEPDRAPDLAYRDLLASAGNHAVLGGHQNR